MRPSVKLIREVSLMKLKASVLMAAACALVLTAVSGVAFGKAAKTALVVDSKPAISTGAGGKTVITAGHLVTTKRCRGGRTVVMVRTDPAGNVQTEGKQGELGRTASARTGTWSLTGELQGAPKVEDRILVMVKKKRSPTGRLLCRGARSELLLIAETK